VKRRRRKVWRWFRGGFWHVSC